MFRRITRSAPSAVAAEMAARIEGDTLVKPRPIVPEMPALPDLAEYEEIASVLGFEPPEIAQRKVEVARREVIEFILDKGFPIYSNKAVHDYMAKLAEKDDKVFVWARLRGETEDERGIRFRMERLEMDIDWRRGLSNTVRTRQHGQLTNGYHRPVPIEMLKRAAAIKKQFSDAEFYVSDYAVVVPDPFIMVKRGGCEHIVFGVWDEPGFGV